MESVKVEAQKTNTEVNLDRAEEVLRDIRERLSHCGGGPDELNKQVHALIDRYWKDKKR